MIHILAPSRDIDADYLGLAEDDPAEQFSEFNRDIRSAAGRPSIGRFQPES